MSIQKINFPLRYYSEHSFFAIDTNLLKIPLTNDGLAKKFVFIYECIFVMYFKLVLPCANV